MALTSMGRINQGSPKGRQRCHSRSYICGLREIFDMKNLNDMIVEVEVAVPNPDKVDGEQVLSVIPFGQKSIKVVEGGCPFRDGHSGIG